MVTLCNEVVPQCHGEENSLRQLPKGTEPWRKNTPWESFLKGQRHGEENSLRQLPKGTAPWRRKLPETAS